ncbi:class I SAM-dependent methyltransferase [Pseudoalteromonas sp. PS5]|uniref:O-methyltransferase n=1 Tax=Pseudoalteromonas sp. PS5 TaxID=1437473 RepID=UPI000FFEF6C8|nr:class I SAM-dependent methyltransferase [Pseudoalteromonas sp. PS5]RXE98404.1 hypothetical protein D9603_17135 [Pseudoalteromonas sp. PS5]
MKYIKDTLVLSTLESLYQDASHDFKKMFPLIFKFLFSKLKPKDCQNAYLPIDKNQGEFLYDYIVSNNSKNIVEFGTSFGISTIYLAAGAREIGGHVITTELVAEKCKVAMSNFHKCNLAEFIKLKQGDALETLANYQDEIDLLVLDGWGELYLPILKLLEPRLSDGALVYADNASFPGMRPYMAYVTEKSENFETKIVKVKKGKVAVSTYRAQ